MKTGDFLNTLAGKIGKTNDSALKDFVSADNHIELPDDVCNAIVEQLMSLDGAKNNSTVKAHFVAQALNAVDSELATAVSDFGLDSELFGEEKNTHAKLRKLKAAFRELLDKKPEKSSELEKTNRELHQKWQEVQKQLADVQEKSKKEIADVQSKANAQVLNHIKTASLKGLNWANKDQPEEVQIELANLLMSRALANAGVKEVNNDGKLELVMDYDPTIKYSEKGVVVEYESFKNKVLADSKLLAVTDPKPPQPPQPPQVHVNGFPTAQWTPNEKAASILSSCLLPEN